jgi:hypothetical protein
MFIYTGVVPFRTKPSSGLASTAISYAATLGSLLATQGQRCKDYDHLQRESKWDNIVKRLKFADCDRSTVSSVEPGRNPPAATINY